MHEDVDKTPLSDGSLKEAELINIPPGTLAGDYAVGERLAVGGCGAIFRAQHRDTGRAFAIKFLHPDLTRVPGMLTRFELEARAAAIIKHPSIVEVFDFGTLEGNRPYFTMELLDGQNLSALIKKQGRLTLKETAAILAPVCSALEAAHKAGLVHRDIKGENIFIEGAGADGKVKLLDFGIAKLLQPDPGMPHLTTVGMTLGSPTTISPEQIRGEAVDARADIYSLGIVIYQALTGEMPFVGTKSELVRAHLISPAPAPSRRVPISPEVDAVVLRCLEKDPVRRFSTTAELLAAFQHAVDNSGEDAEGLDRDLLALYVEAAYASASEDEMDQALDDISRVLDAAEQAVRAAGYSIALPSGTSHLGIRLLPASLEERQQAKLQALSFARGLHQGLVEQLGASRATVNLCVHAAQGLVRVTPEGLELLGGPIAQLGDWAPSPALATASATTQVAQGLLSSASPLSELHVEIPRDLHA